MSMIQDSNFLWGNFNPEAAAEAARRERIGASWEGNELDRDAFLRLLITQMQFQDPLDPVSDKEFVAQLAQFTALEQMNNMNASMRQQQAFAMVGRMVEGRALNPDSGLYQDIMGRVDAVVVRGSESFLMVNGFEMALNRIRHIGEDELQLMMWNNIGNQIFNSQNIGLIGRTIQALVSTPGGMEFVEGKVDFIRFINGAPMLVVDGRDIDPRAVMTVADDKLVIGKTVTLCFPPDPEGDSDERVTVTGRIDAINIIGERAFVRVGEHVAEIGHIDVFTEAMRSKGRQVSFEGVSGEIAGILVRDALLYATVVDAEGQRHEIRFENVRAGRPQTEETEQPNEPEQPGTD